MQAAPVDNALRTELGWFLAHARAPRLRSMREFAESEIVIPDGPYAGRRFRCSRQPYTGLWFDAVDSGRWSRHVATGPTQSGKTLCSFVIPLLYHLFEVGETVICGLPDMDMAADKWREDILPVIEQSRYRHLLPRAGGGSRGGRVESIQFTNGATLKFMSGGGSDKSRAGFTSRVVVVTETDGMDQASSRSRESDKITQLEARTRAYGSRKRVYLECTVSTEEGRTWQEYQKGTASRIVLRCPHCEGWVSPEREHLVGWREANSQAEARRRGAFSCPACQQPWSNDDRIKANVDARLVHAGQTIVEDGSILGDPPETDTLAFRWSAVHNLFLSAGEVAADEWRASRSSEEENAEREMRQFVWCLPAVPLKVASTALAVTELAARGVGLARGIVPADAQYVTAGVDIGKYLVHWMVVAWSTDASAQVVDYGRLEVASTDLGLEKAVMLALREYCDLALAGWPREASDERVVPQQTWVDAGYVTESVYAFCRESGQKFRPAVGRGVAQQRRQWYNRPTSTGSVVKHIGQGFHLNLLKAERVLLVDVDADHWKTWVHERLNTPIGTAGTMTFFRAPAEEHLGLAKHLTAETKTEEFIAGRGLVTRWERLRRQNHWFDCLYLAAAAASLAGVRLVDEVRPQPTKPITAQEWFARGRRSARPSFDLDRWRERCRFF